MCYFAKNITQIGIFQKKVYVCVIYCKKIQTTHMDDKKALERIITILSKLHTEESIIVFHSVGLWMRERIESYQESLTKKINELQKEKEKINENN